MKLSIVTICIVVFVSNNGSFGHKRKHTINHSAGVPKRYSENNIVTTQNVAAKQAATQVKAILAQKAVNAATTAKAALVGKEVLVQELIKRVREAEISLTEQDTHLQQARNCAEMAYNNVLKQQSEIERLTHALAASRLALQSTQKDARVATERYESLSTVIEAAKEKYSYVLIELKSAKTDLEATRSAAHRAEVAAEAAKANINTPEISLGPSAPVGNGENYLPKDPNTIDVKVNCPTSRRSIISKTIQRKCKKK